LRQRARARGGGHAGAAGGQQKAAALAQTGKFIGHDGNSLMEFDTFVCRKRRAASL
jgi:hypothetical protein